MIWSRVRWDGCGDSGRGWSKFENEVGKSMFFLFFEQERGDVVSACLVGSGMCIGDR